MADLNAIPGLKGRLAATRRRLRLLRAAQAFWPLWVLVGLFLVLALSGLFDRASAETGALSVLILLIGGGVLFVRGRGRHRTVTDAEARAALDRQSELRPLATLTDRPARPLAPALALWRAHEKRLVAAAESLKPPSQAAAWRKLDPVWLRAVLPAAIIGLTVWAGTDAPGRIARALSPDYGALMGGEDVRVEAWITPPDYTGKAPIFLTADRPELAAPAGSEITLRAQAPSAPKLLIKGHAGRRSVRFEPTPDGAYEIEATIEADARVSVRWWGERAAWTISADEDAPPSAVFVSVPELGDNDRTVFDWSATDDFGVERLELALRLVEPHPAAPHAEDRAPVPMRGVSPKEAAESAALDLTRHRWAGLEVEATLVATDAAGQTGRSDPHVFVLPEKLFLQPLARSVQEIRVTVLREPRTYAEVPVNHDALRQDAFNIAAASRLEQAPPGVQRASLMLEAVSYEGFRFIEDTSVWFGLRSANAILTSAHDKPGADSVDPILWAVALKAEYGSSADALAALLAAKKALENALRTGASEAEIKRLTEAFKQAAQNYVQAKIAEAVARGLPPGQTPGMDDALGGGGQGFGQQTLDDMLNALSDLTETGASDQARQLLSDITGLLEGLQFQQGGGGSGDGFDIPGQPGGEGEEGEASQEERELSDAIGDLSDTLREQRELNDDTVDSGRSPQPGFGEGSGLGEEGEGLAERQQELAEALGRLRGERAAPDGSEQGGAGAGDEEGDERGGGVRGLDPEQLAEIERFQQRAAEALRRGDLRGAQRSQERATGLLSDAIGDLAGALDALREARNAGDRGGDAERDPFGRARSGVDTGDTVDIPDEAERQRAKDILDELRRRYENSTDPEERSYLRRLLDRF